ncbi:hypothetical protein SAMN04490243_2323 [Robiginitalea myxolifaciens]|uniref:Spheroidene monooxygenase n=1 Tax=Robiginitalea myxolifaciens TaxID=400055 RepID=A0A1I6H6G4_9FLAO|nr:hypothetical protein [Robiginitalea myxolifaciens]SFR49960.1 hypothetical protein SAMN04490243_2323 [Robiginitalea myxolifaciens]
MPRITTISLYHFQGFQDILWALKQNKVAREPLEEVAGLTFYKLMGSGASGYSIFPDWNVYAILQVWESEAAADDYFRVHPLALEYANRAKFHLNLYLNLVKVRGAWDGENPFGETSADAPSVAKSHLNNQMAVLTRATIKKRHLFRFWKYVPHSQKPLNNAPGLIFHKGIGEVPLIQMATFSIWKDAAAMKSYAYGTQNHQGAIQRTRKHDWYREELFARFTPFKSLGSWPNVPDFGASGL